MLVGESGKLLKRVAKMHQSCDSSSHGLKQSTQLRSCEPQLSSAQTFSVRSAEFEMHSVYTSCSGT